MCDSIANGGPVSYAAASTGQCCPPANVIIASNVLSTNGNVIAGNIISVDGTFTGNLYVAGQIIGNVGLKVRTITSDAYYGNGYGLSNLNASNISGSANLSNLAVTNSVTTTNLFFQNAILDGNLPIFNTAQGTWGSSANVSQITVDQYGRVSQAANVGILSSQWTNVNGNVAYQNGVSIGTLTNPPTGSNLYVLGTATITGTVNVGTLNVSTLEVVSNLTATVANVGTLNVISISNLNSLTTNLIASQANVGTLNVYQISNLANLVVSNSVTTTNIYTAGFTSNASNTIFNSDTITIPFIYATTLNTASTANVLTASIQGSIGVTSLTVTGNIYASNAVTTTNLIATTANVGTLNVISISNLNSLTTSVANVGTLNVISISNLNSLTTNLVATTANVGTLNVISISNLNSLTTNLIASVANVGTLNVISISNLNSLTTNLIATTANVGTLNVWRVSNLANLTVSNTITTTNVSANLVNVSYLTVTSNILPGAPTGNTYLTGNLVVSGNVFTSLGSPLGAGGGYYLSLPTNIAVQTGYNGAIYGTAYPFSIGLSNGFTINGTSTLITVTTNGNFKFNTAGPYILNAVLSSSDNITGLALGSNVADIHGQDQNYLYRYTIFVSQNPTEVIKIPINVTDTSLYYYLDIFKVGQGTIYATNYASGGTYLTIAPLTGGGLATGGPGGTPGTQWISSGSNIYFPNSVGIGAVNPAYNLDVSGGTTATRLLVTSNIASLGLYGPTLNISSNVIIQSNLAVGGGAVPFVSPPYALYVTGQGYFSQHVSYQNFAGFRNRLVNGTFRVAARANTITVSNTSSFSVSNTWVCDRWRVDVGGLSTSNVSMIVRQDVPIGTTNGFTQCANVYVTRGLTGTTGNTWVCPLSQTIEASFIFDFKCGQPTAKYSVFSFYANTSVSGDYSVVFRSRQDNTYFANLVSITSGTWNVYTIYLPPCLIGSWAQPSTDGYMDVLIGGVSYGVNSSNNRAVAVTSNWTANPGFAPVSCIGATKWPASAGTRLQITAPQLEEGTIATPFEIRPLNITLLYCQRFFEMNTDIQYASALGSGRVNSVPYVTTKRNNANVSVYRDLSNLTANTNISQFVAYYGDGTLKGTQAINSYIGSDYGFTFNFTNTGSKFMDSSIMEAQFVWQADAEIY